MKQFRKRILSGLLVASVLVSAILPLNAFAAEPSSTVQVEEKQDDLILWYDTMAGNNHSGNAYDNSESFYKALPQGNGRLGAMIYGNYPNEHIELNEATFWSAGPGRNDRVGAADKLSQAQELVLSDQFNEADSFVGSNLIGSLEAKYQSVGSLDLDFGHDEVSNYERALDLRTGLVTCDYVSQGATFHRESFVSYPDQVMVMKISTDTPGAITMTAEYDCSLTGQFTRTVENGDTLVMDGQADSGLGLPGACKFQTRTQLIPTGGKITATDTTLTVEGADSVLIITGVRTNFTDWTACNEDQVALVKADMEAVQGKSYEELKEAFLADYQELFSRVDVDLGGDGEESGKNMRQRIAEFSTTNDPDLVETLFQYGRYLMICASREGGQPMNLQGIWNKFRNPAWDSKMTTNINYEMNYWPALSTNLEECFEPFVEKAKGLAEAGNYTAKTTFGIESEGAWTVNHNTDLWNRTGPIDGSWGFWPTGGGWISNQLFDAYEFTMDEAYLEEIYPVIKGSADFLQQLMLETEIRGQEYQVIAPSNSPEMSINDTAKGRGEAKNTTYSVTMDNGISRQLFQNVIQAADILGYDDDEVITALKEKAAEIRPNQFGEFGQVMEWQYDWDDEYNSHRHISQLYDLFPGDMANLRSSPELYKGVEEVLLARGDEGTGWSEGWKLNCWARMEDGEHAYKLVQLLISPVDNNGRLYDNLWDAHPPFQIDGNFGFTSGIAEMLLQSQNNEIVLLPAIPARWSDGHAYGLCARGNFEVDQEWADGVLTSATIESKSGGTCNVRYGDKTVSFETEAGKTYHLDGDLNVTEDVQYYGNIALGKTVTASTGDNAANIVDGSSTTEWVSAENQGDGSTLVVDLGKEYTINRWVLETAGETIASVENDPVTDKPVYTVDNPRDFVLYASSNNQDWVEVDAVYGNEKDVNDRSIDVTARYIKLELQRASSADGGTAKVEELQLWGLSDEPFAPTNPLSGVTLNTETGVLSGTTAAMEYSTDSTNGSNGTWQAASAGSTTIAKGNVDLTIRVREAANWSNVRVVGVLPTDQAIAATGVTISKASVNLKKGEQFTLTANVYPYNVTDRTVSWTSSNPDVVDVTDGVVTALGAGTVTITAKTANGKTATCNVTSTVGVEEIRVTGSLKLSVGTMAALDVEVLPADASNKQVFFSSSNPAVATVTEDGIVHATGAGTAEITVTSADGSHSAVCVVTATGVAVEGIALPETLEVYETMQEQLHVTFTPGNATNKTVGWSSSDSTIATVDENGVVTGVKGGSATITAVSEDGGFTASTTVTVLPVTHVTEVSFAVSHVDMTVGDSSKYQVTILPEDAHNKAVTYVSSNPEVATVSESGLIEAVDVGDALITVITADGQLTDTLLVQVYTGGVQAGIAEVSANLENPSETGAMAVDGSVDSKWCHDMVRAEGGGYEPMYLTLKLDQVYTLTSWKLIGAGIKEDEKYNLRAWAIEISEDGTEWTEVVSVTDNTATTVEEPFADTPTTQWVRLKVTEGQQSDDWYGQAARVHEFQLFGTMDTPVESVSVPETLAIAVGQESYLMPQISPATASNRAVTYESSDPTVAAVDEIGCITALKAGEAVITVTTEDGGYQDTCTVVISEPVAVEGVELDEDWMSLEEGETAQLTATVLPENATNKAVTWTTSDEKIATVDQTGKVTAVAEGKATITVTTAEGGKTASCEIIVVEKDEGGSTGGGSAVVRYTITVTQTEGGTISPSTTSVTKGSSKAFTITADEGWSIADVLVDGKSVGAVSTYTFENVSAKHTITAEFKEDGGTAKPVAGFTDVTDADWFADAVQYVVDEGLMNGTSETAFSPKNATTRGMIVTILYRLAGSPEVESDGATWWSDARVWAMEQGVSDGTNMDGAITREQLATMLYRYAGSPATEGTLDSFTDADSVSEYAVEALKWAAAEGIVTGKTGGVIDPQAGATRAETAAMLMRFCQLEK